MPFDPRIIPRSPEESLAARLATLERRVAMIERGRSLVYSGPGPPAFPRREGSLYVDTANHRLYVRESTGWRYVATTP